ncbi:MAG: metallophosphoesterase [Candidatus Brockarchaeota archaeon]|nr:metallophosphoesterase [Candidatus Brockarchaeota archaeon]
MKLWDSVEIVEPYPAAYIGDIDCLVISDLHLGYEGIMAEHGVMMPKVQFEEEVEMLEGVLAKRGGRRVLLNGDIKHEFSTTSYHEFKEVDEFLLRLTGLFEEVIIIKGNHDNYIERVTSRHGIGVFSSKEIGGFLFAHGHRKLARARGSGQKCLVMGHEHPVVALTDEVGAKERVRCFLYGDTASGKILVMPAFSTLAYGSEVNAISQKEWLSPVLREVETGRLNLVGVSREAGILEFGKLRNLQLVS